MNDSETIALGGDLEQRAAFGVGFVRARAWAVEGKADGNDVFSVHASAKGQRLCCAF